MTTHEDTHSEQEKFDKNRIIHINFNQDQGCFVAGTETGFRVFNTDPFKETFSRDLGAGVGYVEMLYRSNILALVGGGTNPKAPLNTVLIWDDNQGKVIASLKFNSEVKSVKLKSTKVAVILENKVYIYNFSDLKLIDLIETCVNVKGLYSPFSSSIGFSIGLSSFNNEFDNTILACPDKQAGHVIIRHYDKGKTIKVKAHQSSLSFLELNQIGNKLASTSEKGTIIRIHDPLTGQHLQELRRGLEYAQIYSLSFDYYGRWLAIACDSGTIHIFNLKLSEEEKKNIGIDPNLPEPKNPKSKFWFMKYILPYFDSEWSFAKFRVKDTRTKVGFGPEPNSIIVVSYEGNYYSAFFDPIKGGESKSDLVGKIQNHLDE